MIKKSLTFLLWFIFLIIVLGISIVSNISSERLTPWVELQVNQYLKQDFEIEIGLVQPNWNGLQLEKIKVIHRIKKENIFVINTLTTQLDPVSLAINQGVPFQMTLYRGEVRGVMIPIPPIKAKFTGVGIMVNDHPLLRSTDIVASAPSLDFNGTATFSDLINGTIGLSLSKLKLSGQALKPYIQMQLPDAEISSVKADLLMEMSTLKITAESEGDVVSTVSGDISLNMRDVSRSGLNLNLTARLKEKYYSQLGFLKNIIQSFTGPDGQVSIQITGDAQRPNVKRLTTTKK